MKILAIDTSADETSVSITESRRVLSYVISSQIKTHKAWGGIVPSIAKLAHEKRIDRVCELAVKKANLLNGYADLNAIAVTYGPGLSIALEVGIIKAKQLALKHNLPLYAVNHMEGHMYSPFVQNSNGNPDIKIEYPFLSLLISGGHTMIVNVKENGIYEILGETQDDAAGEALDKAAKMLGLGYPGGPVMEKLAEEVGQVDKYKFPRPMIHDDSLNMSFSGLKTHFFYLLKGEKGHQIDLNSDLKFLASSFQEAVFDVLVKKTEKAIIKTNPKSLVVGGGVSSNKYLRKKLRDLGKLHNIKTFFPSYKYLCGDNASMIGVAAHMMIQRVQLPADPNNLDRVPRLTLAQNMK
ncbi:MAG: tRNA (adenosine(37)-N6)-threonylcarbamoyltransferase complex transferase subunit TsaD [Patescibacteria group bacterium]